MNVVTLSKMKSCADKLETIEKKYTISDTVKGMAAREVQKALAENEGLKALSDSLNKANVSGIAYSKVVSLAKELEIDKVPLQGDSLFTEFSQLNIFLRGYTAAENERRLLSIGDSIEDGTDKLKEYKKEVQDFLVRLANLTRPLLVKQEQLVTSALEFEIAAYEDLISKKAIQPKGEKKKKGK